MNVWTEATIVTKTLRAAIMLDHLFVLAFLASLEMEPIAKVCFIGGFQ